MTLGLIIVIYVTNAIAAQKKVNENIEIHISILSLVLIDRQNSNNFLTTILMLVSDMKKKNLQINIYR